MSCFPEWIYSVYIDGELADAERRPVESHLVGCQTCRKLIVALREESELLGDALHEREPASLRSPAAAPVRGLALGGLPTLAAVGIAAAVAGTLLETRLPSYAEWLNPMRLLGAYDMAFEVVFWIRNEVPGLLEFAVAAATLVSVAALLTLAVSALSRRWLGTSGMLAAAVLALCLPSAPARALVVLHDVESFHVAEGETRSDSIVVSAESVRIDGVVDGDLFVFCERLIVRGEIRGNLFAGVRNIEFTGKVGGSLYGVGRRIHVAGEIASNIVTASDQYMLDDDARIGGDALHVGESVTIQGSVARDLYGFGEWIELGGQVGRNLNIFGDRATLLDSARVGGDFYARLPRGKQPQIDPAAEIGGETTTEEMSHDHRMSFLTRGFWIAMVLHIAAAFAVGAVMRVLVPSLLASQLATSGEFFRALGLGFVGLFVTPIALFAVGLTVAGIPLALMGGALYLSALFASAVVVAALVGRAILERREEADPALAASGAGSLMSLLLGVVVVVAAAHLPFLGPLFGIVIVLTGLGLLVQRAQAALGFGRA